MDFDLKCALQINAFGPQIRQELMVTSKYERAEKDILIVVHNQLQYLQACIESIRAETEDYHLYVWDNGSDREMKSWLENQKDLHLFRSEENLGFIIPNNRLAEQSRSPYLILLNSDTIALQNWDKAIISHLQNGYSQVGYSGGYLDDECRGRKFGFGEEVDFIPGWCFGISRTTFERFGLFDEQNLTFAYGEDADLSLRLKEQGLTVRALHLDLVYHHQNVTIKEVVKGRDCHKSFLDNHLYLKSRWETYLGKKRLCSDSSSKS
jgi:GT2 family glycosyltransferase